MNGPAPARLLSLLLIPLFGEVAMAQTSPSLSLTAQRQLFVDDVAIEETYALERTMCLPAKVPGNPIMSPERPWEGGYISPVKVLYDPERRAFRMWYRGWSSIPNSVRHLCYATSRDGVNWERPNLGLVEFRGSKDNNLVRSAPDLHLFHDPRDPDPARRYKSAGRFDTLGLCVAFSADGMQWTKYESNPVVEQIGDSHSLLGWDEVRGEYVGYFRPVDAKMRKIGRSASGDFVHWAPVETVLEPDEHDPVGTQFYDMYVSQYEGLYFGALRVLHIDSAGLDYRQTDPQGLEQTADAQLAFSRDGINWTRLGNRQTWMPLGPAQSWDDRQVYPSEPMIVGDEIWIYYGGVNLLHQSKELRLSGERVEGRWRGARIGLAKLRRDGWVVARPEPGADEAWLLTKPMTLEGHTLWVNADAAGGALAVEVLDDEGRPMPGYGRGDCEPIAEDATAIPVRWRDRGLRALAGRPLRLKFYLTGVLLYSFWCHDDAPEPPTPSAPDQ